MDITLGPSVLLLFAVILFLWVVWHCFGMPHKHKYSTTDYPCVKYARCWCGAGIAIDAAVKSGIKIYCKHTFRRLF